MSINPKVSVCIPTYKQVDFLRRTLNSVQSQTYKDYEIIISDDSPDDSVESLLKDFDFGSSLKYYKNEISYGTPENWNQAISKATGKYIKILHHDDYLTFDYSLQKFVDLLDHNPTVNFACSATSIWNLSKGKKYLYRAPKKTLGDIQQEPEILFTNNWVGAPSTTIYRASVNTVYDKNMKWLVDIDFYIRILQDNSVFGYCTEPLITTPKGVAHQVTEDCKDNREVEFFEYFYLYNKLKKAGRNKTPYLNTLAKLFLKYKIERNSELAAMGVTVEEGLFNEILEISKNPFKKISFRLEKIKNLILQA